MSASTELVARLVHYSGLVQGVGFRATVAEIARRYSVTGWVRNLSDRRVQLLVEGPLAEVEQFLDTVRTHWQKYIKDEQEEERPPTGTYREFAIAG